MAGKDAVTLKTDVRHLSTIDGEVAWKNETQITPVEGAQVTLSIDDQSEVADFFHSKNSTKEQVTGTDGKFEFALIPSGFNCNLHIVYTNPITQIPAEFNYDNFTVDKNISVTGEDSIKIDKVVPLAQTFEGDQNPTHFLPSFAEGTINESQVTFYRYIKDTGQHEVIKPTGANGCYTMADMCQTENPFPEAYVVKSYVDSFVKKTSDFELPCFAIIEKEWRNVFEVPATIPGNATAFKADFASKYLVNGIGTVYMGDTAKYASNWDYSSAGEPTLNGVAISNFSINYGYYTGKLFAHNTETLLSSRMTREDASLCDVAIFKIYDKSWSETGASDFLKGVVLAKVFS